MALQITDANFEELVNSGKPMVLDFWAEWWPLPHGISYH